MSVSFTWRRFFPGRISVVRALTPTHLSVLIFNNPCYFFACGQERKKQVTLKLQGIPFEWIGDDGIALENSTNIKDLLKLNEEVVVQDISSQETGKLMQKVQLTANPGVWDCCAASGGKSILVSDIFPSRSLTVSDVRPGILSNLHNRLREAGLTVNESHVIDLSDVNSILPSRQFDLVIADVPCSGSGTWGRTPEQLYFSILKKSITMPNFNRK
ncbi:MAG: hypothetical protein NVV59_11120 [Chitinophagaceae bacterium]|nr:hypothetical protein [Chitinophagaceae bacterium]